MYQSALNWPTTSPPESRAESRAESPQPPESPAEHPTERGSAPAAFIAAALGAICFAGVSSALVLAGFMRVKATDAVAELARYAMAADSQVTDAAQLRTLLIAATQDWPIRLTPVEITAQNWTPRTTAGQPANTVSGLKLTVTFAPFWHDWLNVTQVVRSSVVFVLG